MHFAKPKIGNSYKSIRPTFDNLSYRKYLNTYFIEFPQAMPGYFSSDHNKRKMICSTGYHQRWHYFHHISMLEFGGYPHFLHYSKKKIHLSNKLEIAVETMGHLSKNINIQIIVFFLKFHLSS